MSPSTWGSSSSAKKGTDHGFDTTVLFLDFSLLGYIFSSFHSSRARRGIFDVNDFHSFPFFGRCFSEEYETKWKLETLFDLYIYIGRWEGVNWVAMSFCPLTWNFIIFSVRGGFNTETVSLVNLKCVWDFFAPSIGYNGFSLMQFYYVFDVDEFNIGTC